MKLNKNASLATCFTIASCLTGILCWYLWEQAKAQFANDSEVFSEGLKSAQWAGNLFVLSLLSLFASLGSGVYAGFCAVGYVEEYQRNKQVRQTDDVEVVGGKNTYFKKRGDDLNPYSPTNS